MSSAAEEAGASSSRNTGPSSARHGAPDPSLSSSADQTASTVNFRNGVTSPGSPGSEADSTINSTTFAPSLLASRLGRSIYSSAGAAGSTLSLSGSGFNSPSPSLTGFNAVSTVLNNPSKRQHPIDPNSSRFPQITPNHSPADIPKVKKAELDPYLSSVRPEWDRFMRNQSIGRQGKATIEQQQQRRHSSTQDSSYDSEPLGKSNGRHRSTTSTLSLSADLQAVPPPQSRKRLPNLSAVPQVFFSEDFDLGNPYTFDQVTERYKVTSTSPSDQNGSATPTYDVALNQMLQEKLSYYSDVVEQHLIIEIGQQSSSFFAALGNLNDLNAEAESCLRKINALKSELELIDDQQAKKGLHIVREQQHRRQLERKQTAVQQIRQIIERRDLVRLLLQQGETEEALDLLNKLRSTLHSTSPDQDQRGHARTPATDSLTHDGDHVSGIALSDLKALASIPAQLDEMEQSLSGLLEQDLIAVLKQDIDARLAAYRQDGVRSAASTEDANYFTKAAAQTDSLGPHSNITATESLLTPSKPPTSPFGHSARPLSSHDADLAARIAPIVVGLAKTGGVEKAVAAYREVAIQAVQNLWKETLSRPSSEMAETVKWLLSEDVSKYDDHDNLPPPAVRIRDLEHTAFLNMGRELFDILIELLKGIDAQCKLVPRILDGLNVSVESNINKNGDASENANDSSSELPFPPVMPQGVPAHLPSRLSEVVVASAEQAHTLCSRLLVLRASTHAALELPPFLVVFQLCWSFILSSEQLCRKMIVGLRGTVLSQAKGFLANFHRRRIERAAKAVEEEMWAQAEVGAEIQAQIRQIVSSAVEDPADFVVTGSEAQSDSSGDDKADAANSSEDAAAATTKTLDIEDRQYFVVDASLDVLSLLVDYLKVIINLPLLTTEAMARVVEFLKQFNSRTCQVVLGAGAMRSAGLKNITAKHLALASQSLSIMISLIPYIRETVRRHLSPKQAVMLTEFDKLRRDFQEHQYEIHAKLVAIMSDRLTVHCRTLSAIDWNAGKPAADGDGAKEAEPNKYAADLVKETATLHKVLSKYLQAVVVEHVIGQVLRSIDARLAQEFEKVNVQNQNALERMQIDVRYLGTKLATLKHVEWKDEALQQVLETKRVAPPPTVNVTTSGGPSTPQNETAPGSPALAKPAASQFGPVSYKPRIPNIFARRQQQQQQQSQSGSPRASSDVQEAQRSQGGTPRTSFQQQQQQQQTAVPASAQGTDASALDPPVKTETSGARSIEEENNEVPPTPPSKTEEIHLENTIKDQETDPRESEDIVAPVVPAPDAVARILSEGEGPSSDLPAAPDAAEGEQAPAPAAENVSEPVSDGSAAQEGSEVSADQPFASKAKDEGANVKMPSVLTEIERVPNPQAEPSPSTPVKTSDMTQEAQLSTPTRDPRNSNVSFTDGTPAESSPARSGASTPATVTPSGTPAKPGRMSLKERLAEAARKRALQSAPQTRPSSQAEADPALAPHAEEKKAEEAAKPTSAASLSHEKSKEQAQTTAASPATDVSEPKPDQDSNVAPTENAQKTDDKAAESASAETAEAPSDPPIASSVTEASEAEKPKDLDNAAGQVISGNNAVTEDSEAAPITPSAPSAEDGSSAPNGKDATTGVVDPVEQQVEKPEEAAEAEAEAAKANGSESSVKAPTDTKAEAEADQDGDVDDVEGDADANEGTNDSAVGGSSGAGGKKNKKKKKKGKKK